MKNVGIFRVLLVASTAWFIGCSLHGSSNTESSEKALDGLILEKVLRAGLYQAASKQAEKEGYIEIATYLGEIAEEERGHAMRLSNLRAEAGNNTKKNLALLLKIERSTVKEVLPSLIDNAKQQSNDALATLITQIHMDDQRHLLGLKGTIGKVEF